MKVIASLTDKIVLGTDGLSKAKPRYTARAILQNKNGLYAVMYAEKYNLYSLPGGGVEEGEDVRTALRREILEETGCTCDKIEELGIIKENRFCLDYTQENYYFVVTTTHSNGKLHLTDNEVQAGTSVLWYSLDEVVRLISDAVHDIPQRKYLQARDVAALQTYLSMKGV